MRSMVEKRQSTGRTLQLAECAIFKGLKADIKFQKFLK